MDTFSNDMAGFFRRDLEKLADEIEKIPEEFVWKPMPGVTNSCGVLAQHIVGNLNHFIGTCMGDTGYERKRDLEFTTTGVEKSELVQGIHNTAGMIDEVLENMDQEELTKPFAFYSSDDFKTGEFLIHLYGHLNYHLGQVNYLRRIITENKG